MMPADSIVQAALIAQFGNTTDAPALQAAVAMLFIFEIPYDWCLDGLQFTYISEIWPSHLRAKGMSMGVAMISLMVSAEPWPSPRSRLISIVTEHHVAASRSDGVRVSFSINKYAWRVLTLSFRTIGWKFFLCFIIPGSIGAVIMFVFFPNTKGMPLEEVAALFGDADEVSCNVAFSVSSAANYMVTGGHLPTRYQYRHR